MNAIDRFWSSVDRTNECWLWMKSLTGRGYGQFWDGKKLVLAHRWSYELNNGPIHGGLFVCHTCDVPRCVNPCHLFLGTHKENMHDCVKKGRHRHVTRTGVPSPKVRGVRNAKNRLSEQQVHSIVEMLRSGTPVGHVASAMSVGWSTIWNIKVGNNWSWLTGVRAATKGES